MVIDVQEDLVGENRHKKFTYKNPELLIKNINNSIEKYKAKGYEIIYVAEVFPSNLLFKLIVGNAIRGTEGAKLVKGLNIVSKNYFEKIMGNAFSNKELCKLIAQKNIDKVVLCGFDEAFCVSATAKGGLKLSLNVSIIKDSVDTINEKKAKIQRAKLKKRGVKYI